MEMVTIWHYSLVQQCIYKRLYLLLFLIWSNHYNVHKLLRTKITERNYFWNFLLMCHHQSITHLKMSTNQTKSCCSQFWNGWTAWMEWRYKLRRIPFNNPLSLFSKTLKMELLSTTVVTVLNFQMSCKDLLVIE